MTKAERIQAIERIIIINSNITVHNIGKLATAIEEAIGVDEALMLKKLQEVAEDYAGEDVLIDKEDGREYAKAISTNKEIIKIK